MELVANVNTVQVLLIDDDEVDTMHVQRQFKKLNMPVTLHVATNGVDALNQLQTKKNKHKFSPEIIILDIMMPKMNGIEFLQKIRNDSHLANTHILILTTSNNEKDKLQANHLNVDGYFIKDTQFSDFINYFSYLIKENNKNYLS